MKNKRRTSRKRLLCRVGLSLLLAVPIEPPLLSNAIATAHAAEGEGPSTQPVPDKAHIAVVAAPQVCGTLPAGIENTPELLALANWPLDEGSPSTDCTQTSDQIAAAAPGQGLPPPIEIHASPVVRVVAAGMEEEVSEAPPRAERVALVSTEDLDDIRGGFELPDLGLKFSFGIERAVFVNGELVATTVLNVQDLQQAAGGTMPTATISNSTPQQPSPVTVVQSGTGNGLSIQLNPNMTGTVIQNTLNDQQIKTITTISGTINSAQLLRSMNLQSAILDGVIGSLRR